MRNNKNNEDVGVRIVEACKDLFIRWNDFSGVSTRTEYWTSFVIAVIVILISSGLLSLILFVPMLSVTIRRLRDTGINETWVKIWGYGQYFLIGIIMVLYMLAFLVMLLPGSLAAAGLIFLSLAGLVSLAVSAVGLIAAFICILPTNYYNDNIGNDDNYSKYKQDQFEKDFYDDNSY